MNDKIKKFITVYVVLMTAGIIFWGAELLFEDFAAHQIVKHHLQK